MTTLETPAGGGTESPEERDARQEAERGDPPGSARALLRKEHQGALATISLHRPGFPFGSVAPYALSARGQPLLLMSALAQHTKNALADGRASLLVQDSAGLAPGTDPQAHGRLTLLGRVAPVPDTDLPDARARLLARHPQAARTAAGHDFRCYELAVEEARFIGGFGNICWIPGASIVIDPSLDPLQAHRRRILEHMNADHADALALYCRRFRGLSGQGARMVGVDGWGFDVEQGAAGGRERVRFDFAQAVGRPQPLSTSGEVRRALVEMVKVAR